MDIPLAPDLEKLIRDRVLSGRYASAEDVVRACLQSLIQQESIESLTADEMEIFYPGFREKIAEGIAQADAGMLSDGEEFFDQLERDDAE